MNYILIDGSYFIFYRYHALIMWWKKAKTDQDLGKPSENTEFIEKFRTTFIDKIREIKKKLKLKDAKILIGRDCSRCNIWRNEFTNDYKENRKNENDVGYFFKLVYNEEDNLFLKAEVDNIIYLDKLEADDSIALTTKYILKKYHDSNVTIITSDTDYFQLIQDRVSLINLKFKPVNNEKNSYGNPDKDLFMKVLLGDKSDNIPSIFDRCGKKTAEKYYYNRDEFNKRLESENKTQLYNNNLRLISFNSIPQDLSIKLNELLDSII